MKKLQALCLCGLTLLFSLKVVAQHNNEFFNQGAEIYITSGADVHVWGDMVMKGSTGLLDLDGVIYIEGNLYSDGLFQQRGTGTVRLANEHVNVNDRQIIEGSYAVRGSQSQIGVNDGSFYNLELANSRGLVHLYGSGNVADVRNSVNFKVSGFPLNRIITNDSSSIPSKGEDYGAVFGIMNDASGLSPLQNNTISLYGNVSGVDSGYVQGKLRRAIHAAGGAYGFPLGLDPGTLANAHGVQYVVLNFGINTYNFVTGYYNQGNDNSIPGVIGECFDYHFNYFGGLDHGEWMFSGISGGAGTYSVQVYPQDAGLPSMSAWLITQDDTIRGTPWDCDFSPVGLERSGFNYMATPSEFGVAGADVLLSPELAIGAHLGTDRRVTVDWAISSESGIHRYLLEHLHPDGSGTVIHEQTPLKNDGTEAGYQVDNLRFLAGKQVFRVVALQQDGEKLFSNEVEIEVPDPASGFRVFPNPSSSGRVTVEFGTPLAEKGQLVLTDFTGRQLWTGFSEKGAEWAQLDFSSLSAGAYSLHLITGEGRQVLPVILSE